MTSKSLCNMNFIMFLLLCLQYLAVKSQMDTINQTSLTTSPGNCFSNFECPSNKFCFFSDQNNPVHRCMRRSTAGNSCYFGGSRSADRNSNIQTCVNGLTCENNLDTGEYVCVPNLNRGDLCGISGSGECPEGDVCTKGKDGKFRCRPPTSGILGSRCPYSTHCLDNYDLFCQNKVCVRKKATGAFCKYGFQCLSGICTANGRCGSLQRQWEMCLENSHCKNSGNAFRNGNHVYCNVTPFKNELGRCIRDSELLKTLGTSCSPKFDRCDRRRGLSCEWIVSERRFGCQQITIGGLCTPNNKYSRCESNIWPMKCLIALETGEYGKEKPRFYRCFPRRVPVPVGTVCNRAHVEPECPKGTSCERIWGVLEDFSDRYGPPSIQTCLYLRGLGEQCGNRFRTKCKPGLKCEGGTCVNGTELCCPPNTHADIGLPCKTLPCIPGAECVDGWCRKISKVMKLGQPCYESVLYNAVSSTLTVLLTSF